MTKKSVKRASADVGLMLTAYNLRRIINIVGFESFKMFLESRIALFISSMTIKMRLWTPVFLIKDKLAYWKAIFILPVTA